MSAQIRQVRPSDYQAVISVIDGWWGGRQMAGMLPRLFFEHFTGTSFAAERVGEAGRLSGRAPVAVTPRRGLYPCRRRPPGRARPRAGPAALPALLRRRPDTGRRPGPLGDGPGEPRLDQVPPADGIRHRARRQGSQWRPGNNRIRRRRTGSRAVHQAPDYLTRASRSGMRVHVFYSPGEDGTMTHTSIVAPVSSS